MDPHLSLPRKEEKNVFSMEKNPTLEATRPQWIRNKTVVQILVLGQQSDRNLSDGHLSNAPLKQLPFIRWTFIQCAINPTGIYPMDIYPTCH
jgi:hypothetical protein